MGLSPPVRRLLSQKPASGALVGFAVVFVFFTLAAPDTFLTHASFSSILSSQAAPGIAAIGITMLMISGEFDLSVGSILGVSSLAFLWSTVSGYHVLIAAVIGLTTGAFLGLINGAILVSTRIPSFIVTLGTMLVYRAISLTAISGGRIVRYADYSRQDPTVAVPGVILLLGSAAIAVLVIWAALPTLRAWATSQNVPRLVAVVCAFTAGWLLWTTLGAYGFDPFEKERINVFHVLNGRHAFEARGASYRTSIFWWLGLSAAFAAILLHTRFGNATFATGGHAEAASAQGVAVDRVRILNFILSGSLAAFSGIVQVARLKSVDPLRGQGLELEIIASVVIGGTLLTGGYGSILGSVMGTALTGMLQTGLVLIGVPSNAFKGAIGAIMIVAVIINTLVRRERS